MHVYIHNTQINTSNHNQKRDSHSEVGFGGDGVGRGRVAELLEGLDVPRLDELDGGHLAHHRAVVLMGLVDEILIIVDPESIQAGANRYQQINQSVN
jgi:hypothetical protein